MSNDYNNPAFKNLLQKLQEESWQLELIISGFAIFGLVSAFSPLKIAVNNAQSEKDIYTAVILTVALVSCAILIFNLLLHVILRGLWIGALGLRYVSGDIDYEVLNYSPKFTKYLKKKIGSFDKYIATLEDYCSIIFAVSFLLIFYVLAITFTVLTIALIAIFVLDNDDLPEKWRDIIGIPLIVFFVFGMFITFIDFITQGWLKRKQWISKIYFPIYWIFSFVTLSFLYRPLLYNFLDNKFGKRISLLLIPVYALLTLGTSIHYNKSNYFNDHVDFGSSSYYGNPSDYEDELVDEDDISEVASIQSKVITDPFVKVFINFDYSIEDEIYKFNPDLKPKEDRRGLKSDIFVFGDTDWNTFVSNRKLYLKTFNDLYHIKIDSVAYECEFIISHNKKKQLGFETFVKLDSLLEGKHLLNITRKRIRKKDTQTVFLRQIPFWYFKP